MISVSNLSARTSDQLAQIFKRQGYVVLRRDEIPLQAAQWNKLQSILEQMDYVKVVGGDTGDSHSVWVGRFVNDVEKPKLLHGLASGLLDIVMNKEMHAFFGHLVGNYPLCVRRCQANRLYLKDFIGYHIDQDTTPDYMATAVFQFSDAFEGGEFVLYHPKSGEQVVELPKYSVLVMRGDIPHEVMPVRNGVRQTLACFFSTNFGATRKPRSEIKTVSNALSY
jgi:predicted 2-oxoglutarate/Fe(II)-dependent dioxygenase YbiX